MRWQDVIDVLVVTFVLYRIYLWLRGTRALHILIALLALGLFYLLARWSGLFITTWILQYLWAVILVIMVVVFQSEIRQVLERMSPVRFFLGRPETVDRLSLDEVVRAAFELAQKRIGALVVFQRQDILEDTLKGGIPLDGRVSYEILSSIFLPTSPAHDGAVIIREGRIVSVGCYLPLSDNSSLPRNYGTRHRAGIGITERSDALSIIVSEERGEVLLAIRGDIFRMAKPEDLKAKLESILLPPKGTQGHWQAAFTSNLLAKGIALASVLVLWSLIARQERAEMWLTVPLEYRNIPVHMEIVGDLANKVEVGLRGPQRIISGIDPVQVKAFVDLSQAANGRNHIRLAQENIRVPLGAEISKITPPSVEVRLEIVKIRSLPVKPKFTGKLPNPLRLGSVTVDPPFITLEGPESTIAKMREIFTEPIDLSVIKGSVKISAGLQIYPPQIRLVSSQPSQVGVDIKVEGTMNPY
ncbi:MAG: diadenylate cyclase CdaA [Deltaproteobacteria bacterium]|nr:diadenylate cyclase CdaA [Deltaproteobacteria bacterium]